eukprot:Awhi_evm1s13661
MVDLVGRRNATYTKHGAYHDNSSFYWIYKILESAAHTPVHVPIIREHPSCRGKNPHNKID